jgi:hypothetical protein
MLRWGDEHQYHDGLNEVCADLDGRAYLNNALYASPNVARHGAVVNFPKDVYNFDFPLFSSCTSATDHQPKYVHWQVAGASDLVIDGHGSTVACKIPATTSDLVFDRH